MNVLLIVGIGGILLILAAKIYPYWIGLVFGEDDYSPGSAVNAAGTG